jgi:DNA-binding NarL/FixJ family response regulator
MRTRADAPATLRRPGDQAPAGALIRVLVADDSPAFRRVARQVIDLSPGFELAGTAATCEEAVELTRSLRPQLVLLDVRMPAMGGIDAAREIGPDSGARIVLISGGRREDAPGISGTDLPYLPKSSFGPTALRELWDELAAR